MKAILVQDGAWAIVGIKELTATLTIRVKDKVPLLTTPGGAPLGQGRSSEKTFVLQGDGQPSEVNFGDYHEQFVFYVHEDLINKATPAPSGSLPS